MGDNTVFASCDAALGYKTKFSYILPPILGLVNAFEVSAKASAISLIAYLPSNGLVIPASKVLPGSIIISLTSSPKFFMASS